MKCPYCGCKKSSVIDSRTIEDGTSIRRRRVCGQCGKRFTTYEIVEQVPLVVVKRNGNRESFDKSKLIKGLIRACEKRPVSLPQMEQIAGDIEQQLQEGGSKEVSTNQIGEMVMDRLKVLDEVAYVRFASVYRRFTDSGSFGEEVNRLHTGKDRE